MSAWTLRDHPCEAVIFDHDGTLVDTVLGDFLACRDLFADHGVPLTPAHWASTVCGNVAAYEVLFGELVRATGRPLSFVDLRQQLEVHWARHLVAPCVTLRPGVREVLAHLRQRGTPMAVATAASREWAARWLSHFEIDSYFRCITSGLDCTHNKPHPEVYLRTAEALGVPPAACLVFEDSPTGFEAASRAGMQVVMVPVHFARTHVPSHARAVLDSFEQALGQATL